MFDYLTPRLRLDRNAIPIGRDTGADEFPTHARAFEKFGLAQNFVFVLDGDRRESNAPDRIREAAKNIPIFFLPGESSPEIWIWGRLHENVEVFAAELGIAAGDLAARLDRLDSFFASAPDSPSEITKHKLAGLGEEVGWSVPEICRLVSRREADMEDSDIQPLIENLQDALEKWRSP